MCFEFCFRTLAVLLFSDFFFNVDQEVQEELLATSETNTAVRIETHIALPALPVLRTNYPVQNWFRDSVTVKLKTDAPDQNRTAVVLLFWLWMERRWRIGSRNVSSDCALNPSQKRFYSVLFYLFTLTFVILICLIILFIVDFECPKTTHFDFMHLLWIIKLFCNVWHGL